MNLTRLGSLLIALSLAAAVSLPAVRATAAPPGGTPVDIYMQFITQDADGIYSGGTFQATAPLCSLGTFAWVFPYWTLTCADGSGSFNVSFPNPPQWAGSEAKWSFRGGTGAYDHIKGGGSVVSTTGTCGTSPCAAHLAATVNRL